MSFTVYRDAHYTLGQEEDRPYLIADGRRFWLSCSPYEPCLYITDGDGEMTVVHNAFDPRNTLESLRDGGTVLSITGLTYNARDFCRMVEYAAGRGNIGIGDAERVLREERKEKEAPEARQAEKRQSPERSREQEAIPALPPEDPAPLPPAPGEGEDPFYALLAEYPDCVIDYCIVADGLPRYRGCEAHRQVLSRACGQLLAPEGWHYDVNRARGKRTDAGALFSTEEPKTGLSYRRAFLHPPHETAYTGADFDRINAALFPKGTGSLEVYEWTADWSDYFDEGREWWGTLCLTVYDKAMGRFAVILASATD